MTVLIGGAWPYANGSLHIGHLSSLLGGDILARYFRLKGDEVCYVSGSDCHGTPITLRARKEGVTPGEIASRYHEEFDRCFKQLGFTYDYYGKTDSDSHKEFTQAYIKTLFDKGALFEAEAEQTFCSACNQFLPDRFVTGVCPHCKKNARSDQCDHCGSLLDPSQLLNRACGLCGSEPGFKPSKHLFIKLSDYAEAIGPFVEKATGWRTNAIGLTKRYLKEGLKDRAVTRDIDWGIDVPISGYEGKKLYVWVEAVLGYLSACSKWCKDTGKRFEDFWQEGTDTIHYYVHGKDNIPFHTVILPALLLAHGGLKLPDRIISSEYETLEGKKISTSGNWAVWAPYLLERYSPDSIRYFFIANGPERKDSDFSWREFITAHNTELLGGFGNLVNRTLVFVQKYFNGVIPAGTCDPGILERTQLAFHEVGKHIEEGSFRDALEGAFSLVRFGNKYFDEQKPWITVKEAPEKCKESIYQCLQIIANLSVLLSPFIPFSCDKILKALQIKCTGWQPVTLKGENALGELGILFERLDKKLVEEELANLQL